MKLRLCCGILLACFGMVSPLLAGGSGLNYLWNPIQGVPAPGSVGKVPSVAPAAPQRGPYSFTVQSVGVDKAAANIARVRVHVRESAVVWFNGQPTKQTGATRDFYTPPLQPGKTYSYEMRARWVEDGRETEVKREVIVQSGADVDVEIKAASKI